jgi:hypothetical protein
MRLTTERLLAAGFKEVGEWELNSASDLKHLVDVPGRAGVYAFAIDGIVQYVGLASKSLRQRLGFYRTPGPSQRTNVRLNEIIRAHLGEGRRVQVLIAHPPDIEWNGLKISGSEGLEAGLIGQFDMPWNIRGAERPADVGAAAEIVSKSSAEGFYVYENWVLHKAIVHRADCSFCNAGNGIHGERTTKSSTWHGPFETASAALAKAKSCRRRRTEGCTYCSPI